MGLTKMLTTTVAALARARADQAGVARRAARPSSGTKPSGPAERLGRDPPFGRSAIVSTTSSAMRRYRSGTLGNLSSSVGG